MRAVVQRVKSSSVSVNGQIVGQIGHGLNILLGVHQDDTPDDLKYLVEKVVNLRIFDDENGVMNRSLIDSGGEALIVSQFTLLGDVRKGRRPSYAHAAKPEQANDVYKQFVDMVKSHGINVSTGVFQAEMTVAIENDGPVTILLDSHKQF